MYNKVPASPSGARVSSYPCVSFRALGPARADIQTVSPLIPRLLRRVAGVPDPSRKSLPGHKQQEEVRSNYSPILVGHRFTGRQADLGERQGP